MGCNKTLIHNKKRLEIILKKNKTIFCTKIYYKIYYQTLLVLFVTILVKGGILILNDINNIKITIVNLKLITSYF